MTNDWLRRMIDYKQLQGLANRIALNNDLAAYKKIFVTYFSPLVYFATAITRDRQIAEDVVQDVFLKIWTERQRLCTIKNLQLYLYISVRNTAINYYQQQQRHKFFSLDEAEPFIPTSIFSAEENLTNAETQKRLYEAVQQLPPQCRLIFVLVKEAGLRYKEVAELLHLSPKTVENQMGIALKKLAAAIQYTAVRPCLN